MTREHAAPQTVGGVAESAQTSAMACPTHRQQHEIDVVVRAGGRVIAIGAATWRQRPIGVDQLDRLRHLRAILPPTQAPEPPRLLLFSRHGFEPALIGGGSSCEAWVWCALAQLRPGVGAVGDGTTAEAAIADLREALTVLLAEAGPSPELTLTLDVA